MAQLPPDGQILVQLIDNDIIIFDRNTEFEYHRYDATNADDVAIAQGEIFHDKRLTQEQRCFAIFWSGYFYGHAK